MELGKVALPDPKKSEEAAEVWRVYREFLGGVDADRPEAAALVFARHALRSARVSGRPSLGMYACKVVMKTTIPKLLELHGSAHSLVLGPYHDNGLFANVLQLLDLLCLVRADATVLVDWRRKGDEGHFQYGPADFDLFAHLFRQNARLRSRTDADPEALVVHGRVNPAFLNMLRGYLWTMPPADLAFFRRCYGDAAKDLRPSAHIEQRLEEVGWPSGHVVGVHKRLGTPEAVACQLTQRMPSAKEFIAKARGLLSQVAGRRAVYLATDDAEAARAFAAAFPPGGDIELIWRPEVKRSEGGVREDGVDNEVHRSPCEVRDAEDCLIDTLCLARCADLVCIDSNLPIFVSLYNPLIRIHALNTLLPEGWEEEARSPGPLPAAYRVCHHPCVFVRAGPSAATELLGAKKLGEVVSTTGRGFDGWVEIEEGGWMLVDAEQQAIGRGQGLLLEPVDASGD